jgi:hypothetical protein
MTDPVTADRRLSPPDLRAEVIGLACEPPADSQVPLARWSSTELAREAVSRGICEHVSGVTVWRWLWGCAIARVGRAAEHRFGRDRCVSPRLPVVSGSDVITVLRKAGFADQPGW